MPAIETFIVLVIRTSNTEGTLAVALRVVPGEIMSEPSFKAGAQSIFLLSHSHVAPSS